jgi:dTMP kinase
VKGLLITFEGGDGAGKTSLMRHLHQTLSSEGIGIVDTRAPGGTHLGKKVRDLLLHDATEMDRLAELFLFLADRAQLVQEVILPALKLGKVVLCDRFNDSTIAYQGARGLDPFQIQSLCDLATGGLKPDLTFYLDIDPLIGLERSEKKLGTKDRLESEVLSFHQKIRLSFLSLASQDPDRFVLLDAMLSPDTLLDLAKDKIYALFSSRR